MSKKPNSSECSNVDIFLTCLWPDMWLQATNITFYLHSSVWGSTCFMTDVYFFKSTNSSGDNVYPGNILPKIVIIQTTCTLMQLSSRVKRWVSLSWTLPTDILEVSMLSVMGYDCGFSFESLSVPSFLTIHHTLFLSPSPGFLLLWW